VRDFIGGKTYEERGRSRRFQTGASIGAQKLIRQPKRFREKNCSVWEIKRGVPPLSVRHFDVLTIPKTFKFPSDSVLEPLNIELLNREGIERSAAVERLERFELVEGRTGRGKNLADF
jgi:hypothetical protein